ncbi:hypothetical protein K490DRAFT_63533 [Saccharata proteae CBS 121410]|uniref:S-adenosyl-L-methionine-dependent methyltransferase n=1 Tax=Saccharata proteae CBS 121410 TaxID=1314787 RepID=A0A6A5YDI0_9PEZI|nr:hypothetical protein K490DRAFT_63533 [Saccharata proteae CBS 121410]
MPAQPKEPRTEGSLKPFNPDAFFDAWTEESLPKDNDFRGAIIKAFNLPPNDSYEYHAMATVTLPQVQHVINFGGQHHLHDWYVDEEGKTLDPPPAADITAYTTIFSPSTSTPAALRALSSNAKKGSLRATISAHLLSHFQPPTPTPPHNLHLPKARPNKPTQTTTTTNPYLSLWAWTSHNLEWAGPIPSTSRTKISHHILPILYHHFGCIVPSHDALSLVQQLCGLDASRPLARGHAPRQVLEIGSGNGYWAYMLRRAMGVAVTAVDNGASEWRTRWIGDTVVADGVEWLRAHAGAKEMVLLLVYPQVGADFTGRVLRAYEGDAVVVAGTQNRNGFTGFSAETIAEWMARERGEFDKVAQVPLPSFAGKDEALFVFVRRKVDAKDA